MILPTISESMLQEKAIFAAPKVNKISEIIIVGFLPILSDNGPAIKAPINAPNYANETTKLYYGVVISLKSSLKYN